MHLANRNAAYVIRDIIFSKRWFIVFALLLTSAIAEAHNVSKDDIQRIAAQGGLQMLLYAWLGAKHMVTGYDHLLFLVGVVFYVRDVRTIALFVSLFAIGHSITLIGGILFGLDANPYLVDAIIGFSVAYKGFDNLGGFRTLWDEAPDERCAVAVFGLFHGLGLATKLQDLGLSEDGLLGNLISFNVGVELGQFFALLIIVLLVRWLMVGSDAKRYGTVVNVVLLVSGFSLMGYQLALYVRS